MEQEKKKSNVLLWVLGGCGVLALLAVLAFGGALWFGMGQFKDLAIEELNAYPAVQEHLGTIESADFDLEGIERAEGQAMVFEVQGTQGSATIEARFDSSGADRVFSGGTLILPDGTRHELEP